MARNEKTYSQQVIEIADYVFANPNVQRRDVVSKFCNLFQKTDRTIDTYYKEAKEYNAERQNLIEKAKGEVLVSEAKKEVENGLNQRKIYLDILKEIAESKDCNFEDSLKIQNNNVRIRAIQQLAKMEGWEFRVENENNSDTEKDTKAKVTLPNGSQIEI